MNIISWWSISLSLEKQASFSHDELVMVFAGGVLDSVADALDIWVGHEGIATVEDHLQNGGASLLFDDVVFDFDWSSECDCIVIQLQSALFCARRLADVWKCDLLSESSFSIFLLCFLEEVKDIALVLCLEVLTTSLTCLFDCFIHPFFDAEAKHLDLMQAHVLVAYVEDIAAKFLSIPSGNFFFLLGLELVSWYRFSSFNVLFRQFLCGLEPQLLRIFEAHFTNCVDKALLACSIQEVLQMEAASAELREVRWSLDMTGFYIVDDLITRPLNIFIWIKIKATNCEVLELFQRPPWIWHSS